MIEIPLTETNTYWHYNLDHKVPIDKPTSFLIQMDITDPFFAPYWHTQVAAILHTIADKMMEGEDIPTSFAAPDTPDNDFGRVVITGDPVEGVSMSDFAKILKSLDVKTDEEGNIHLSLSDLKEGKEDTCQ